MSSAIVLKISVSRDHRHTCFRKIIISRAAASLYMLPMAACRETMDIFTHTLFMDKIAVCKERSAYQESPVALVHKQPVIEAT